MVAEICWLDGRNAGKGSYEDFEAVRQVQRFVELHGASRFGSDHPDDKIINRAGYIKGSDGDIEYLFLPEVFRTEVCTELNIKVVETALIAAGTLLPATDGRPTRVERVPGMGRGQRCYRIDASKLAEAVSRS